MKDFEKVGEFWLPDDPDTRFAGLVSFTREKGIELKLWGRNWSKAVGSKWGVIHGPGVISLPSDIEIDLLCGYLEDNQIAELFEVESLIVSDWVATFHAKFMLRGPNITTSSQLEFDRLLVKYDHLSKWINVPTMHMEWDWQSGAHSKIQFLPEQQTAEIGKHRVRFSAHQTGRTEPHQARFDTELHLNIWFGEKLNFEATASFLAHLRRFFSFATGLALHTQELKLPSQTKSDDDRESSLLIGAMDLIFEELGSDFLSTESSRKNRSRNFPAFAYSYVRDNFSHYLARWFELEEKIKPALALYLSHTYRPGMYSDAEFLSMAQALEALHKRLYLHAKTSPARRIELIIQETLQPFQKVIEDWFPDQKEFARRIGASRNYYTHYSERPDDPESIAYSGEQLHELTNRQRILMQLVIMRALDFPADAVEDIMRHKPEAGYLKPKKPKGAEYALTLKEDE